MPAIGDMAAAARKLLPTEYISYGLKTGEGTFQQVPGIPAQRRPLTFSQKLAVGGGVEVVSQYVNFDLWSADLDVGPRPPIVPRNGDQLTDAAGVVYTISPSVELTLLRDRYRCMCVVNR